MLSSFRAEGPSIVSRYAVMSSKHEFQNAPNITRTFGSNARNDGQTKFQVGPFQPQQLA